MKTLVTAVDAATAPNPPAKGENANPEASREQARRAAGPASANVRAGDFSARTPTDTAARRAAHTAARTVVQAREVEQGLRRGSKRFGEAVWGPVVRLSGVLWLEVAGVFFGIFALLALGYLWKLRGAWHSGTSSVADHRSFMGAVMMLALFGYFCVSSFMRAKRRERRR